VKGRVAATDKKAVLEQARAAPVGLPGSQVPVLPAVLAAAQVAGLSLVQELASEQELVRVPERVAYRLALAPVLEARELEQVAAQRVQELAVKRELLLEQAAQRHAPLQVQALKPVPAQAELEKAPR
jgi:hypothetical protein